MLYLLRHGETAGDGQRRYLGQQDIPLSETGRRQAQWWRQELAAIPFSGVYCSDLQRCRETARIIAGHRPVTLNVVTQLRELHLGQWEGLPMSEVKERMPDLWHERGRNLDSFRPPAGESFSDLKNRVIPVLDAIIKNREDNTLIVAHAGVNRVILCHTLGLPLRHLFRLGQDHSAMNIIDLSKEQPRVLTMNITPSLKEIDDG